MSDNYESFKAQVKKLTSRVTELEDAYLKMKRMYEDAINNIDSDNFSTSYTKELKNDKNQILYKFEKVNDDLSTVKSEFEVTAEKIKTSVTKVEGDLETAKSEFTQTVNGIRTDVTKINDNFKNYSTIEQTANGIQSVVGMSFMNGITEVNKFREVSADTSKVYYDGEYYYYYNGVKWCKSDTQNVFSSFTQGVNGFAFVGDVQTTTNEATKVDISGTKIDIYKNGTQIPKLSMGFSNGASGTDPFITLGAGNGNGSQITDGFKTYVGQGVIHKYDGGFSVYYLDSINHTPPGIYITENNGESTVNLTGNHITFNGAEPSTIAVFG